MAGLRGVFQVWSIPSLKIVIPTEGRNPLFYPPGS